MSNLGDLWKDSKGNVIAVLCLVIIVFGFYGIYFLQVTRVPAPTVRRMNPLNIAPTPPPGKSRIKLSILVDGMEKSNSTCTISLFHDADEFNHLDKPLMRHAETAYNGIVKWDVPDLASGRFAVAVFEDSNGDGMQNKSERIGYSNNPNVTVGPPKFDDVAITVHSNNTVEAIIHLRAAPEKK